MSMLAVLDSTNRHHYGTTANVHNDGTNGVFSTTSVSNV
jgi:hypothetical protein